MAAVILLLVAVSVSFVAIRLGAAALELTGLPWEQAKFQALSAFTNTGFTTSEAEAVTSHHLRRKIVSVLVVLGNAGLVATVGSFAGTLLQPRTGWFAVNLLTLLAGLAIVAWIARRPRVSAKLRELGKTWLDGRYALSESAPEDLLRLGRGFRISRFEIDADSPAAGRSLRQLGLLQHTVQVLALERGQTFIPAPGGQTILEAGDQAIVYGRPETLERFFGPSASMEFVLTEDIGEPAHQAGE